MKIVTVQFHQHIAHAKVESMRGQLMAYGEVTEKSPREFALHVVRERKFQILKDTLEQSVLRPICLAIVWFEKTINLFSSGRIRALPPTNRPKRKRQYDKQQRGAQLQYHPSLVRGLISIREGA
jgi:hypothetical protein